jgi:hypothetical protein
MRGAVVVIGVFLALTPAVAVAASAPASTDPVRSVHVVDVVPDNRSALSGVHTVEAGSVLLVRGRTNRRPDRTAIDVAVIEGPDADRFGFAVVETWGFDGVWSARLPVPANVTPGTYTLRVRTDDSTDYQSFTVVAEKRATLTVRSLSQDAVVVDATLPDGGYVELRARGDVVGVSPYLSPGTHTGVAIDADTASFTAVAVVGTSDRRLDAYTVEGAPVAVAVDLPTPSPTATPTPSPPPTSTPTASPTPRPSPTRTRSPTDAAGPGAGVVSALLALATVAVLGRRIR